MADRRELYNSIEKFLTQILGDYKKVNVQVEAEASFKYIFKKKNYLGNVEEFKRAKEQALRIDTASFDMGDDDEAVSLVETFEQALAMFNMMCDKSIEFQEYLYKKSLGVQVNRKYKDVVSDLKKISASVQVVLTDLDAEFAQLKSDDPEFEDVSLPAYKVK